MATKKQIISFQVSKQTEDKIYELRKQDRFIRCSKSDVIRFLIEEGLKAVEEEEREVSEFFSHLIEEGLKAAEEEKRNVGA